MCPFARVTGSFKFVFLRNKFVTNHRRGHRQRCEVHSVTSTGGGKRRVLCVQVWPQFSDPRVSSARKCISSSPDHTQNTEVIWGYTYTISMLIYMSANWITVDVLFETEL